MTVKQKEKPAEGCKRAFQKADELTIGFMIAGFSSDVNPLEKYLHIEEEK
jgi:hypothetical protein